MMRIHGPIYEYPQLASLLSAMKDCPSETWLTFFRTKHEFVVSPSKSTRPGKIHCGLGYVGVSERERHRLYWLGLFPVVECHQIPQLGRDLDSESTISESWINIHSQYNTNLRLIANQGELTTTRQGDVSNAMKQWDMPMTVL